MAKFLTGHCAPTSGPLDFPGHSVPTSGPLPDLLPLRELLQQLSSEVDKLEAWGQAVSEDSWKPSGIVSLPQQHQLLTSSRACQNDHCTEGSVGAHAAGPGEVDPIEQRQDSRGTAASVEFETLSLDSCNIQGAFRSTQSNEISSATGSWGAKRMLSIDLTREENENDIELALWFEGITSSDCRALAPHQIHYFFVSADGGSQYDVNWISDVVQEIKEVAEMLPGIEGPRMSLCEVDKSSQGSAPKRRRGSLAARYGLRHDYPLDYLTFSDFVLLMEWKHMQKILDNEQRDRILQIREVLIRECVERLVLRFSGLKPGAQRKKYPVWIYMLEPLVGMVVILNAITLGMSSDVKWDFWGELEILFTLFYCAEFATKVFIYGCREHFSGPDTVWNLFDLFILLLAIGDLAVTELARVDSELNSFVMIRIARLARITRLMRLIRLLRLQLFKELLLMIKGVVAGMRTIGWACVLLATLIYMIAVGLRQTVGEDQLRVGPNQVRLFHSVGWSMFAVFRCFTADCTLTDGTSLLGYLYDHYGYKFVIPYALVTLFVIFGIFNLIMAVFVENVTESARQKRQLTRDDERARVVRKLRQLVMKVGSCTGEYDKLERDRSAVGSVLSNRFSTVFRWSDRETNNLDQPTSLYFQYGGQITKAMFNEVIAQRDVNEILDDLEVHIGDRTEIFDVIDADRTGTVDVSELLTGLLKLRSGGADKSDMVTVILAIRSLQKQVSFLVGAHEASQEFEFEDKPDEQSVSQPEEGNGAVTHRKSARSAKATNSTKDSL